MAQKRNTEEIPASGSAVLLGGDAEASLQQAGPREVCTEGSIEEQFHSFLAEFDAAYPRTIAPGLMERAFQFAYDAHKGQFRRSGAPHIHHCIEVARVLVSLHLDPVAIASGLLHDVVEDNSKITLRDVEQAFGAQIASIVDGVTKISELKLQSKELQQAENFRKMILSMAKDIRVILVKFADRLHNMRTLEFLDRHQQERIALETQEVYAPLAHRLGMARIKWELEDLALRYLDPEAHLDLQEKVALTKEERHAYIEEISRPLKDHLEAEGVHAEVTGRPKNLSSIYRKMAQREKSFEEIYDLFAIRIVVDTVRDCYHAMGIVHSMYSPVEGRIKDFIATPKSNMYRSLHTTVVGPRGEMVEIQIRTYAMHQTAETGIAAHWRYKEEKEREDELDRHTVWLRQLIAWDQDAAPDEFMDQLKIHLFQDEIFVFTPKGDLRQLPKGASVLDFAYSVHTDIGNHCVAGKVGGVAVPIAHVLQSGDTVEIITSSKQKPRQGWLGLVKSAKARSRIRRWLKAEGYADSVRLGKEMIERELRKLRAKLSEEELVDLAQACGLSNAEHLYAAAGSGEVSLRRVLTKLPPITERPSPFLIKLVSHATGDPKGIKIQGLGNLMIRIAQCCNPVPGDEIVGFVTRGRGVSIHRTSCSNIVDLLNDEERHVDVDWDSGIEQAFATHISVFARDRHKLFADIARAISDQGINIRSGQLDTQDDEATNRFVIEVRNLQQLKKVIRKISSIKDVKKVERVESVEEE